MLLGSFFATVTFGGEECVFTGPIAVNQVRGEDGPPTSFDLVIIFNRDLYDAITSRVRWTGSVLEFGGTATRDSHGRQHRSDAEIIDLGRVGALSIEEGMVPGEQATMRFGPVGDRWAIPSTDFTPPEPSTCPVDTPISVRSSPKSFGNKSTVLEILLGKSPAKMVQRRIFQGQTLQKENKGNVAVTGDITSVDDSILYAGVALCYQYPPFGGLRRDEIIRQLAANVGISPDRVICPIGKIVTKPILLSNGSLLPFLNDFIQAENWFASFDEYGRLVVQAIERKDAPDPPDWVLDESLGDFDYDTLEEIPPSKPATQYFVTVAQPVKGSGPGGAALTVLTRTTVEDQELHNPECVKVRPSGNADYVFGDGTYHVLPAEELMPVARTVTDVTTVNGTETKRVVTQFRFYNPKAFDPNFDTYPPGTSYDGAYGNKTFHRDEVESLMEVSEDATEVTLDINGTILGSIQTVKGWYAPHRAATFYSTSRSKLQNDAGATPPGYVYAGGTVRTLAVEVYGTILRVEKEYRYSAAGTLSAVEERRFEFYSPDSRCDLIQTITTPDSGPGTDDSSGDTPPWETPPPEDPPPPPDWHPSLSGPTSQDGAVFSFKINVGGGAIGVISGGLGVFAGNRVPASIQIPTYGTVGGSPTGHVLAPSNLLNTTDATTATLRIDMGGTNKPTDGQKFYVSFYVFIGSTRYWSNTITFDPWAGVPDGGRL